MRSSPKLGMPTLRPCILSRSMARQSASGLSGYPYSSTMRTMAQVGCSAFSRAALKCTAQNRQLHFCCVFCSSFSVHMQNRDACSCLKQFQSGFHVLWSQTTTVTALDCIIFQQFSFSFSETMPRTNLSWNEKFEVRCVSLFGRAFLYMHPLLFQLTFVHDQ